MEGCGVSTWIIPYVDQELGFWTEIRERFGQQVREVYFPMPDEQFASGRNPQPRQFLTDFLRYAPLPKSVLMNPIILPKPVETMAPAVLSTLRQLRDDFGVQSVTVTNIALARLIKEALPDFYVTASVLMGIATPMQALLARDYVDAMTPDTRVLRDLAGLKRLRLAFPGEIRLLVNEACIPGCPFRTQHFYEMGYGHHFPLSLCEQMLEEQPWLRLTGAWVLPRHLALFDGLYDQLKLAGRVTLQDADRYLSVLEAYMNRAPILPAQIGGGPASPLDLIDVSDEWFAFVLHCDKRCDVCSVCREYYEQIHRNQEEES
jgi:collagenase-like PrtC family protease